MAYHVKLLKNTLYTIPPDLPFADTLAGWVLEKYGADPLTLPRILMLLPTRRAARSLREAFLRATDGRPILLPRMQPLGDVDEDALMLSGQWPAGSEGLPVPAFEMKRQFILARLIRSHNHSRMDHALRLAHELARLFDELEREHLSLEGLDKLVPAEFARHWQVTVEFLQILAQHWPRICEEENLLSPQAQRNRTLTALASEWKHSPPGYPVIAAGTTGSIPATAALLAAIAELPHGAVVLPGLDTQASEEYFAHLNQSHPQWGMQQLLAKLGYERSEVAMISGQWPGTCLDSCHSREGGNLGQDPRLRGGNRSKYYNNERATLLSEIMRPAETADAWRNLTLDAETALCGLKRVHAAHVQEEATVIALMLREALETPWKTAALVTHDRALARRVAAIMQRFGVTLDDSAGIPLMQTPAAAFLRLMLEVAASDNAPVQVLSLLKHPLANPGQDRIWCLEAARALEMSVFRTPFGATRDHPAQARQLLEIVKQKMKPLTQFFGESQKTVPLAALLRAHLESAQAMAGDALWNGPEADALEDFISQLQDVADDSEAVEASLYPAVFETLLAPKVYRPQYGHHPRLKILSPMEARMQSFDRIILGGLNEGSWPPETLADPWFSRPMRGVIGLPAPERRIGLAAHDFAMLACGPEVFLTRAEKSDGVPTTPSRWLVKLDVLLEKFAAAHWLEDRRWSAWAAMLDAPQSVAPCQPPAPVPPLAARPRGLSVTQIETWQRDPYSIYARHILGLRPLDALAQEPTGADFGNAVHKALEDFVCAYPAALPSQAHDRLLDYGRAALLPLLGSPTVGAFWWPRFERIARWVIEEEASRRARIRQVCVEVEGTCDIHGFTLKGRADRIEEGRDGSVTIVDYKTGALPKVSEIEEGLTSQLVLLAIILAGDAPAHLEYWQLQGGRSAGKIQPVENARVRDYMEAARTGLARLIDTYNDPAFPYLCTPIAARASRYNDYAHLARMKEWG